MLALIQDSFFSVDNILQWYLYNLFDNCSFQSSVFLESKDDLGQKGESDTLILNLSQFTPAIATPLFYKINQVEEKRN